MGQSTSVVSDHTIVYEKLALSTAIASAFASLFLLILLWKVADGKWSLNLLIIFAMTFMQLLYDVSFYTAIVPGLGGKSLDIFTKVFQLFGGIGCSLYSNASAFITLYVISKKLLVRMEVFTYISIFSIGIALINAMIALAGFYQKAKWGDNDAGLSLDANKMYYWIRLISIFINFVLYFGTYLVVRRLLITKAKDDETRKFNEALITITNRLKYYPLIQAISRSGLAVYEFIYGFNFNPQDGVSPSMFGLQLYIAIFTPAASVGYLTIFLVMQPNAYNKLCELVSSFTFCLLWPCTALSRRGNDEASTITSTSSVSSIVSIDVKHDTDQTSGVHDGRSFSRGNSNAKKSINRDTYVDRTGSALSRFSSFLNGRSTLFDGVDDRDDDVLFDIIDTRKCIEEVEIANVLNDSIYQQNSSICSSRSIRFIDNKS